MFKFTSLFSGSSGNSYLLETDETKILIDAGKSGIKIIKELEKLNIDINDISAIILSHEHSDHSQSIFTLSRKFHIPIYISDKTINTLDIKTDKNLINTFEVGKTFKINNLNIDSISTSHDAIDPCSFSISNKKKKVTIATDMGIYTDEHINFMKNSNLLLLEANYEKTLLELSSYPYYLKKRISSTVGHLSNNQMSELLSLLSNNGVKTFILGHLSKECNHPDIVTQVANKALKEQNKGKKTLFQIANREEKGETIKI